MNHVMWSVRFFIKLLALFSFFFLGISQQNFAQDCDEGQENTISSSTDIGVPLIEDLVEGMTFIESENYLYVGFWGLPATVKVYDITEPGSPVLVNTQDFATAGDITTGAATLSMYIHQDQYLIFACRYSNKVYIVDITDPLNMTLVSTSTPTLNIPYDIEPYGDYLFISNEDNRRVDVLDISDINNPTFVANTGDIGYLREMALKDDHLFVSGATALYSYDISDPLNMVIDYQDANYAGNGPIFRMGNALYQTFKPHADTNQINVFDISNPANPVFQTAVTLQGYARDIETDGKYLFVSCDMGNLNGPGSLTILDITNPLAPSILAESSQTFRSGREIIPTLGYCYMIDQTYADLVTYPITRTYGIDSADAVVSECDSYTWIDGFTYTQTTDTAVHELSNAAGCDSVVSLDLTINYSASWIDTVNAIGEHLWIDGNTYSENNTTATHLLTTTAGCDSLVTLNLTVTKNDQVITFNPFSATGYTTQKIFINATTDSGLPLTFTSANEAVATIDGDSLVILSLGSTDITASQAGNTFYNPAVDVVETFTVSQGTQTITFDPLADKPLFGADFELLATSTSELPVSFTSSDPGIISITGTTATIVGVGTAVITASQDGDVNYAAASPVDQNQVVVKASQTVSFTAIPQQTFGDPAFTLAATTNGTGTISFISSNPSLVSITGNTATILGAGDVDISAIASESSEYLSDTSSQSITVNKAAATTEFLPFTRVPYYFGIFNPVINVNTSGGGISFTTSDPNVASVSGPAVQVLAVGTTDITVSTAETANYNAAPDFTRTLYVMDLALQGNNSDLTIPIVGATWDIQSFNVDPTDFNRFEGVNLPAGLSIQGTQLVANGMWSGTHKFTVQAISNSDAVLVQREFTFDLPDMDISGTQTKMYADQNYDLRLVSLQSVTNPVWKVDGNTTATTSNYNAVFTGGTHDLELSVDYNGNTYTIERSINVLNVDFDIAVPSEPIVLNAEGDFSFAVTTNFNTTYGFNVESIEWDFLQNGTALAYGAEVPSYRAFSGDFTPIVRVRASGFEFTKEFTYTVFPEPFIDVPNINGLSGEFVNAPVTVSGMPSYSGPVNYEISDCQVDGLEVTGGPTISGVLNWAGQSTCTFTASAPNGDRIQSQEFEVYAEPEVMIYIPDEDFVLVDKFFAIRAETNLSPEQIDRYEWTLEGPSNQFWNYLEESPWVRFIEAGDYSMTLNLHLVSGQIIQKVKTFKVNNDPNIVLIRPHDTPEFFVGREQAMLFALEGPYDLGPVTFSLFNAPNGIQINRNNGVLIVVSEFEGQIEFEVHATLNSGVIIKTPVMIMAQESGFSVFKVVDQSGNPVEGVQVRIEEMYEIGKAHYRREHRQQLLVGTSDENGHVQYIKDGNLMSDARIYQDARYVATLTNDSNDPSIKELQGINPNQEVILEYNVDIQIQGFDITYGSSSYDKGTDTYFFENLLIHDQVLVEGSSTISNPQGGYSTLTTSGKIRYNDATAYLVENTESKEYLLSSGVIVASTDSKSHFALGKYAGLDQDGVVLEISEDKKKVSCQAFPKMPWMLGEVFGGFADESVKNSRSMIKNPDQYNFVDETGRATISALVKSQEDKFKFPELKVVQVRQGGADSWDFTMKDLTFTMPNGMGVEELTFIYLQSEDYLQVGGKINFPTTDKDTKQQREFLENLEANGELKLSLDEFSDTYEKLAKVEPEPLIQTTSGEFVDISPKVRNDVTATRSLPLTGLGMGFAIKKGVIDSVAIYAGTEIKFPQYGMKIVGLKGGLFNLSKTDSEGFVTYNPNFSIFAGCELEDIASGKFTADATVTIALFNSVKGDAEFKFYNFDIGKGSFLFRRDPLLFKATAEVNILSSFFKGNAGFSAGYDLQRNFDIAGSASLAVGLPDHSVIPSPFRGLKLGSAQAGFNKEKIGAKVLIGVSSTTRSSQDNYRGWFVCDVIVDAIADETQPIADATTDALGIERVDVHATLDGVVTKIEQEFEKYLNIEVGVGYDFNKGSVLFGSDVVVPQVRTRHTRGDTVEYVFDISDDIERVYIMMDNGGSDVVIFDVYGPTNEKLIGNIEHLTIEDGKYSFSTISLPETGTYTIKVDTSLYGVINYDIMMVQPQPTGVFAAPLKVDTNTTQLVMKFNDLNDTLKVRVFVDSDKEGYDGSEIAQFKILNNGNVKFDYEPEGLLPGDYYFYFMITDRSGIPVVEYAQGGLHIEGNSNVVQVSGLTTQFDSDTLRINWDDFTEEIEYVKLQLFNLSTGELNEKEQTIELTDYFAGLSPAFNYELRAFVIDSEFEYSEPVIVTNITMPSALGQNAPRMVNYPIKPFQFQEGKLKGIALTASDADGDDISYSFVENLPKTMGLVNDSLFWGPEVGDAGQHTFHLVISDGLLSDTVPVVFDVKGIVYRPVDFDFNTAVLHESENMSLSVRDDNATSSTVEVYLVNFRTEEFVLLPMNQTKENNYSTDFQLSISSASEIPVIDGDTIIAIYVNQDYRYVEIARFDAEPQISDHTPPSTITDLEVFDYNNELLMLTFTVPQDSLDNGTLVQPWIYDLRFAGQAFGSDEDFVNAEFFDYYETKPSGEKDTVFIEKSLILDFDILPEVWFSMKAGDSKFNYGMMSNGAVYTQSVPARNVVATLTEDQGVTVKWDGTIDTTLAHFVSYKVYRSNNEDTLEYFGEFYTNSISDDLRNGVRNGNVQYSVVAQYVDRQTKGVLSNDVLVNLYSDVQVRVLELDSGATDDVLGLNVRLVHEVDSLSLSTTTNAFGYAFFSGTWNDEYTIEIRQGSSLIVQEDTVVNSEATVFDYVLALSDSTIIGFDELAESNIQIVPNPTSGEFFIRGLGVGKLPVSQIKLMGASGQDFAGSSISPNGEDEIYCDIRNLRAGVYLLTISTNDQLITRKVYVK